jgi:glycosyltransferase involved in cell wall biosynthesis
MKDYLILIQSTDATVDGFKQNGLWIRQRSTIEEYCKVFHVLYFTSDWKSYQDEMPDGAIHIVPLIKSKYFGVRHILYYIHLIISAFKWGKYRAVIRVFGVTLPVLGFIKYISAKNLVISFQYDWAEVTRMNYRNIKHYVSRWVEKSSISNADFIIATMQWLKDKAINTYNISESKCCIIPNYVDLNLFYPEKKEKVIVYAGRLHWSKGVNTLINAFLKFSETKKDYKLYIFGKGEETENLKELSKDSGQIFFMGAIAIDSYAKYLRTAEVFVLPSLTMEGHPKALIEAMASGCKCIASDVPGNRDVFIEADCKELFEAGNEIMLLDYFKKIDSINFSVSYNFAINTYAKDKLFEKECSILSSHLK